MDIGTSFLYSACRLTAWFVNTHNNYRYGLGGTGFVVKLADDRIVLVTNRHVVDDVWINPIRAGNVLERLDVEVWQDNTTKQQASLSPQAVRVHTDATIDIAAAIIDPASTVVVATPPNIFVGFHVPWSFIHDNYQQYGQLVEAGKWSCFRATPSGTTAVRADRSCAQARS